MKAIVVIIFITLSFTACRNKGYTNSSVGQLGTDPVSITAPLEIRSDTVSKMSKPFKINNIKCYWKHQNIGNTDIIIQLRASKTKKILLEHLDDVFQPTNYNAEDYFTEVSKNGYADVNFDGFTDILIRNYTSTPMNDVVHVYLYNPNTKGYTISDELSDNRIDRVDKENRKLITGNEYRYGADSTIHSFDKAGKIKYTEVYSNYRMQNDTTWLACKDYKKLINGEPVIERTVCDTIRWK